MIDVFARKERQRLAEKIALLETAKRAADIRQHRAEAVAVHYQAENERLSLENRRLSKCAHNAAQVLPPMLAPPRFVLPTPSPASQAQEQTFLALLPSLGQVGHLATEVVDELLGITPSVRACLTANNFPDCGQFIRACPSTAAMRHRLPQGLIDTAPGFEKVRAYGGRTFRNEPTTAAHYLALVAHADYLIDIYKPLRAGTRDDHWLYRTDRGWYVAEQLSYPAFFEWQEWKRLGAPQNGIPLQAFVETMRKVARVTSERGALLPDETPRALLTAGINDPSTNWINQQLINVNK